MKIVVYTLTNEGIIPDYVIDGGYLAWDNGGVSPQNLDLVGLATDEAPQEGFVDQNALTNYVEQKGFIFKDLLTLETISSEVIVSELWAKLG
jgi:hypothetical protein